MKIWLGTVQIASGDREGPSGFTLDQDRLVQAVDYIGEDYGANLARRQRRHTIQFTVSRLHATEEEAEAFVLEHADTVPDSGTLTIETTNGRVSRWIADVACARVSCVEWVGLHTRWAYTLIGGRVLTQNPDTQS